MDPNRDYMLRRVGDQDVLVPLGAKVAEGNVLIVLNPTARRLWDLLAQGRSPDELAEDLVAQYGIGADCARADVRAFLDDLGRAAAGRRPITPPRSRSTSSS